MQTKIERDQDGVIIVTQQANDLTAAQIIELHPEHLAELEALTWVSVGERLPEEGQKVYLRYTFLGNFYFMTGIFLDGNWCNEEAGQLKTAVWNRRVTHWRPLPAPPREG